MLIMSLSWFFISLKTYPAGGALAVILLVASYNNCDNENIILVGKVFAVIVTTITVYLTYFI